MQIQQITYYRAVKPPTLRQFVHRMAVAEIMEESKGEKGTGIDYETGRLSPLSAIKAKELLRGLKADELMKLHPSWVEEYNRRYANDQRSL